MKTNKGAQKNPLQKKTGFKSILFLFGGISTYATTMCTISAQLVNQQRAQNRAVFRNRLPADKIVVWEL